MKAIGSEYTQDDVVKPQRTLSGPRAEGVHTYDNPDNHPHSRMMRDLRSAELTALLSDQGFELVEPQLYKRIQNHLVMYITVADDKRSCYFTFKYLNYTMPGSHAKPDDDMWEALCYNGYSNLRLLTDYD